MWRGQADINWPIHSSAYRRLAIDETPTEDLIASYEERLLEQATHRGFRDYNGRRLSDFDLLARLQHHGTATRLVDATRSALVGLYFAVATQPTKVGALFGFHAHFLGGYEGFPKEVEYRRAIENLKDHLHPQTWEPPSVSPRIAAQHSQFLYSAVSSNASGSLCISFKPSAFLIVAISPKLKRAAVEILSEAYDIRHATLFPDIDGFGYANSYRFSQWDSMRW